MECFEHRHVALYFSRRGSRSSPRIFQTIPSLTYAALNIESLSYLKNNPVLFKDNDLESVCRAGLGSHKHILPQECTVTFCQRFPDGSSCVEPCLPQSPNRLFGGCVNVRDLRWSKLSVAATGNPQKIQPVYFMIWNRMATESHKVRSLTIYETTFLSC